MKTRKKVLKSKQAALKPVLLDTRRMTKAAVVSAMRRLTNYDEFQILRGLLVNERTEILEDGKKDHKSEQWAVLDGFDRGAMLAETWAAKKLPSEGDDSMERLREAIQA